MIDGDCFYYIYYIYQYVIAEMRGLTRIMRARLIGSRLRGNDKIHQSMGKLSLPIVSMAIMSSSTYYAIHTAKYHHGGNIRLHC
jgi:hypothetical protein